MDGYNGTFLRVNLSSGALTTEHPSEDMLQKYLGGRGIIAHELLKRVPPGADPLGPANTLVFALGTLTGYLPGSGRNSVGAKSPLTGAFGESEAGGFWGAELKRGGFDAVIITGKSPRPVYLSVDRGNPQLRDALNLWGKEIGEADQAIKEALGSSKIRTAIIGPAGENQIPFASVHNDITHVYGRTGMGAVMGSKNLKAIAVRGGKFPPVADKAALVELSRWMNKIYKKSPLYNAGTGSLATMASYNEKGNLPINNFNGGRFANVEKITAQTMRDQNLLVEMHTCFACPIHCKKRVQSQTPWKVDPVYGGPEYETLAAFGSNCGVDSIHAIMKANEICNRYGLDTISTGVTISFAMECFEKGLINAEDTDGLKLTFGNAEAMVEMVGLIAQQKGFGAILAQGSLRAAQLIGKGAEQYAMQVKALEIPMHDPRHYQGLGLHFSIHSTGADHCTGVFEDIDSNNIGRYAIQNEGVSFEPMDKSDLSPEKGRFLYDISYHRQLCNSVGLCTLAPWNSQQVLDAVRAATGWEVSYQSLRQAVSRSITLARVFNLREGFTHMDDKLPERFNSSPVSGGLKNISIDREKLAYAQEEFFHAMGWDRQGVPTSETLTHLDIQWCRQYLNQND